MFALCLALQVRCNCVECVSSSDVDSLRHSRSRLNIYRALSSPSLIALSSEDPFLTAFRLSWELQELSKVGYPGVGGVPLWYLKEHMGQKVMPGHKYQRRKGALFYQHV